MSHRTLGCPHLPAKLGHERIPGEESPIGPILCASADSEQVELLELDAKSIRVSEYLTELPRLELLQARLHQAIEHAREQTARRALHLETEVEPTDHLKTLRETRLKRTKTKKRAGGDV